MLFFFFNTIGEEKGKGYQKKKKKSFTTHEEEGQNDQRMDMLLSYKQETDKTMNESPKYKT
jgi:hypothetical protein